MGNANVMTKNFRRATPIRFVACAMIAISAFTAMVRHPIIVKIERSLLRG
jgi:hypothetical protein